jgi:hypothetical protein
MILWPGVFSISTLSADGLSATVDTEGCSTTSIEQLLAALSMDGSDTGELVGVLSLLNSDTDDASRTTEFQENVTTSLANASRQGILEVEEVADVD